jgi:hypothetical protein
LDLLNRKIIILYDAYNKKRSTIVWEEEKEDEEEKAMTRSS